MKYPCEICGKLHYRQPARVKAVKHMYCSRKCSALGMSKYPTKKAKGVYLTCPICGNKFYVLPGQVKKRKYCSYACANESFKKANSKSELICLFCGKAYPVYNSYLKIRISKYCSKKCQDHAAELKTGHLAAVWKGGVSDKNRLIRSSAKWRR